MAGPDQVPSKSKQIAILNHCLHTVLFLGAKSAFWMLADFAVLDIEKGLWSYHDFQTYNSEDSAICMCENYFRELLVIAEKLQNLHLTEGEVNILRAVILFNPGRLHFRIYSVLNINTLISIANLSIFKTFTHETTM